MKGDRQKCFTAGMDDYVSKPFDRQKLFTALQRNLEACGKTIRPRQTPLTPTPAQNRPENEFSEFLPALDIQEGMDRLGIDLPLYISILEEYSEQHQGIGDKLSTLLTAGDYEEAFRIIHTLKGASGNISAAYL